MIHANISLNSFTWVFSAEWTHGSEQNIHMRWSLIATLLWVFDLAAIIAAAAGRKKKKKKSKTNDIEEEAYRVSCCTWNHFKVALVSLTTPLGVESYSLCFLLSSFCLFRQSARSYCIRCTFTRYQIKCTHGQRARKLRTTHTKEKKKKIQNDCTRLFLRCLFRFSLFDALQIRLSFRRTYSFEPV